MFLAVSRETRSGTPSRCSRSCLAGFQPGDAMGGIVQTPEVYDYRKNFNASLCV